MFKGCFQGSVHQQGRHGAGRRLHRRDEPVPALERGLTKYAFDLADARRDLLRKEPADS